MSITTGTRIKPFDFALILNNDDIEGPPSLSASSLTSECYKSTDVRSDSCSEDTSVSDFSSIYDSEEDNDTLSEEESYVPTSTTLLVSPSLSMPQGAKLLPAEPFRRNYALPTIETAVGSRPQSLVMKRATSVGFHVKMEDLIEKFHIFGYRNGITCPCHPGPGWSRYLPPRH
ncbi:hypothetical protein K488DRAFT_90736 [Vararia minispora EC-137]|uniref:Uncharacterized protein n=1 Tax=Vararia minispora EC-137 TaxID=1314806 RepID=A0ACB8Q792_9AGAM|nr:hypothetical protein K488DRAFT_90736 [Vararia minispora EC-137]